jgi:hypothetical protein
VLLHALVQGTLDPTAVGIGSQNEPLPGRAQLCDLGTQPVERFPQRLGVPSLQVTNLLLVVTSGSSPSSHGRRQAAQHPLAREASPPRTRLPPP